MVDFWSAALGYVPRAPAPNGWVVLRDPRDLGPKLSFETRDRRARARSWIHLDLYASDRDAEVARLAALGGRRYA